jgi:hypothetical protein
MKIGTPLIFYSSFVLTKLSFLVNQSPFTRFPAPIFQRQIQNYIGSLLMCGTLFTSHLVFRFRLEKRALLLLRGTWRVLYPNFTKVILIDLMSYCNWHVLVCCGWLSSFDWLLFEGFLALSDQPHPHYNVWNSNQVWAFELSGANITFC